MNHITLTKNDYRRVCESPKPLMTSMKKMKAEEFLPGDNTWGARLTRWLMKHDFITVTKVSQRAVGHGK